MLLRSQKKKWKRNWKTRCFSLLSCSGCHSSSNRPVKPHRQWSETSTTRHNTTLCYYSVLYEVSTRFDAIGYFHLPFFSPDLLHFVKKWTEWTVVFKESKLENGTNAGVRSTVPTEKWEISGRKKLWNKMESTLGLYFKTGVSSHCLFVFFFTKILFSTSLKY